MITTKNMTFLRSTKGDQMGGVSTGRVCYQWGKPIKLNNLNWINVSIPICFRIEGSALSITDKKAYNGLARKYCCLSASELENYIHPSERFKLIYFRGLNIKTCSLYMADCIKQASKRASPAC